MISSYSNFRFLEIKPKTGPLDYWNITKVNGYYEFYIPAFNHTFHNTTTLWNPRLNETEQYAALIVPVVVTIIIWIYGMRKFGKYCAVMYYVKFTWDAIDVVLDTWIFMQSTIALHGILWLTTPY